MVVVFVVLGVFLHYVFDLIYGHFCSSVDSEGFFLVFSGSLYANVDNLVNP